MGMHGFKGQLRRLGMVAALVALAGGLLPASGADATTPAAITDLTVSVGADEITLVWTGGAEVEEDAVTVAEAMVAHPWLVPRLGEWFTIQDQVLNRSSNTITLPTFKTVWPVTFTVRVRQYYEAGDPDSEATTSPTRVLWSEPEVGPAATPDPFEPAEPNYAITAQDVLETNATAPTGVEFATLGWGAIANPTSASDYLLYTPGATPGTGTQLAGDVGDPVPASSSWPTVALEQPRRLDGDGQPKYKDAVSSSVMYDPGDPEADPPIPPRYFMAYVANRNYKPVHLTGPNEDCYLSFQAIGLAYSDDGTDFDDLDMVVTSPTEDEVLAADGTVMLPGWDEDPAPNPTVGISTCDELTRTYGNLMVGHNYVGTASLLRRDDTAYLYFLQDTNHPVSADVVGNDPEAEHAINDHHTKITSHRPAVARASLADLRAAAEAEDATGGDDYTNGGDLFVKYSASPDTWAEDGLGGATARIVPEGMEGQNGVDVIASDCKVYLLTTTYDFQSVIAGHRSAGSSILIGSSTSGTDFAMESLKVDLNNEGVPFADLMTTAVAVSGEAEPKHTEDASFELLAFRRPVPRESLVMEMNTTTWTLDRLQISDLGGPCP